MIVAWAALLAASPAFAASTLAPFQMVRSLQLVQDRIAGGDHAALPMQNKLLGMIDTRMRSAETEEFADARNFNALLVYGMSGGNPKTLEQVLTKLELQDPDRALGKAIVDFLKGQPGKARASLSGVDPMAQPAELGGFLALIKGSVAGADDPKTAIRFFDQARLLSAGTLVEEAALRRSIPLFVLGKDAARFLIASSDYVRGYLRSPYAGEFAQSFVAGVIDLRETIDMAAVDDIISGMTLEQQEVIYLRLARKGAIDNMPQLSAFAAEKIVKATTSGNEDPRAVLYASMSTITAANIEEVAAKLKTLDRQRLSAGDRRLLEAVEAVVEKVLEKPVMTAAAESGPGERPAAPDPGAVPLPVLADDAGKTAAPDAAEDDAVSQSVAAARLKLAEIDTLLGDEHQ